MKQNLLNIYIRDVVIRSPSPNTYCATGAASYLHKLTRSDVFGALPGALKSLNWADDYNGDVITHIELREGQDVAFRWTFDANGYAEMLNITAGKPIGDHVWREAAVSAVLDGLPGAQLSVHFRDEYADIAAQPFAGFLHHHAFRPPKTFAVISQSAANIVTRTERQNAAQLDNSAFATQSAGRSPER